MTSDSPNTNTIATPLRANFNSQNVCTARISERKTARFMTAVVGQ